MYDGYGERHVFDRLILCAGLQSDAVAQLAGDDPGPAIIPFRGEYYRLRPERTDLVALVYPVPDPAYPFLGVHLTPRMDGPLTSARTPCSRSPARATCAGPSARATWSTRAIPGPAPFRQHWKTARDARLALERVHQAGARAHVPSDRRAFRARRDPRPGGRPRRLARGRLPDQHARPDHGRAQRPLPGRHLQPGHRRARRRPAAGPADRTAPAPYHTTNESK